MTLLTLNVKHFVAVGVLVAYAPFRLCSSDVPATRLLAPDGQRVAYVSTRAQDGWGTIMLSNKGNVRDLLPGDASGKLRSPGRRQVALGIWLNNRDLTFEYHCGTGCVGVYKINVDNGPITELWTGEVDRGVHWSPRRDRALVEAHLGGLVMIYVDGWHTAVAGCEVVAGKPKGHWYAFEGWLHGGADVRVRKIGCDQVDGGLPAGGERLVWDGRRFTP